MGDKTIKSFNIFSRNQQKIQKKHHSCMLAILTEVSLLQLARRWCWERGQNWSRVTVASCQPSTCRGDQGEPASAPGADTSWITCTENTGMCLHTRGPCEQVHGAAVQARGHEVAAGGEEGGGHGSRGDAVRQQQGRAHLSSVQS